MTYVIFDPATGEILGVDRGARSLEDARAAFSRRPGGLDVGCADPDVIEAPDDRFEPGKLYKVDLRRRVLIEAGDCEGVGMALGSSGGVVSRG